MKMNNKIIINTDMAIKLLFISVMFVLRQSVKLVPGIYELSVCNHFKIVKEDYNLRCQNSININVAINLGNLLCCVNSAVNFLLYMVRGKRFRHAFYTTYFWGHIRENNFGCEMKKRLYISERKNFMTLFLKYIILCFI